MSYWYALTSLKVIGLEWISPPKMKGVKMYFYIEFCMSFLNGIMKWKQITNANGPTLKDAQVVA